MLTKSYRLIVNRKYSDRAIAGFTACIFIGGTIPRSCTQAAIEQITVFIYRCSEIHNTLYEGNADKYAGDSLDTTLS